MNPKFNSTIFRLPRYFIVGLITVYRVVLSPMKNALLGPGGCCRFYPSCSNYAIQSVIAHGVIKGIYFSFIRLGKCQPFHLGGYDPVKPATPQIKPLPKRESLLDV
jgi:uncharacterized protein